MEDIYIILAQAIFAVLLIAGLYMLFGINPLAARVKNTNISFAKTTAKARRMRINAEAELSRHEKFVLKINSLLAKTGKGRSYLYTIAALFFLSGITTGFICFQDAFLSVATGAAFIPLTYLYLILKTQEAAREELSELQTTMSIITNAYLANNNILKAVELYVAEKNKYGSEEKRKITPFDEFVTECVYFDNNIERGLLRLSAKINNRYFDQWVKNLRLCIKNREMRFSLQPVLDSMADEKIMQIESDAAMVKTWQMYLSTVAVMFSVILVFRIARKEWYLVLVDTPWGKAIILMMILAALLSAFFVIRINKPLSTI